MRTETRLCATTDDVNEVLSMAKDHPAPEYDCTFERFCDVTKALFSLPHFRGWLLYVDEKVAGYVMAINDPTGLCSQVSVFDIYLKPEFRGSNHITHLVTQVVEWARELNVKRIRWTSKYPTDKWERILQNTVNGIKIDEYKTFIWEVI